MRCNASDGFAGARRLRLELLGQHGKRDYNGHEYEHGDWNRQQHERFYRQYVHA
jgi:hypothetical protein